MSEVSNGRHVARPRRSGCGCGGARKRQVEQVTIENVPTTESTHTAEVLPVNGESVEKPSSEQSSRNLRTSASGDRPLTKSVPRNRFTRRNKGKR